MAYKFPLGDAVLSGSLTAKQGSLYSSGSLTDIALRDDAGVRRFDVDYAGGQVRMRLANSAGAVKASIAETGTISGSGDLNALGALVVGAQAYGLNANGALTASSMASNWTNAGRTVADMGIVTTIDINGGTVDGAVIGGASAAAGTFTALSGTTLGATAVTANSIDLQGGTATVGGLTAEANLDIGAYTFRATQFTSDIADGTAPLIVTSTTKVANLNADKLDGNDWAAPATLGSTTPAVVSGSHFSGSGIMQVGGAMTTAGTVKLLGVADTALAVGSDSFYFKDGDGLVKSDSMADYATAIAGDGLVASSGVLAVSLTELTEAAVNVAADSLIFIDADGTVTRRDTFADYATAIAGNALVAASGVLAVQTSGSALSIASDKLGISGSIAGDCLDSGPGDGVDSIRSLHVVADESTIESVGRATLRVKSAGITATQLATSVAGVGILGGGGTALALDFNELTAAAVDVATDSIGIIDFNDSNASRKESIADLATAMAGAGITATNGVFSTDAGAAPTGVGNANATLTEGTTYGTTTLTADRTWTLPASPDDGDQVRVKAPPSLGGFNLLIAKQGSHTIDGANDIVLESDSAAVTLVYVATNLWKIM